VQVEPAALLIGEESLYFEALAVKAASLPDTFCCASYLCGYGRFSLDNHSILLHLRLKTL